MLQTVHHKAHQYERVIYGHAISDDRGGLLRLDDGLAEGLPATEEITMTSIYALSGVIALLLFIYLVIVLLYPESFS